MALVEMLAAIPIERGLRFEAKVVNEPRLYRRRDTAILYVGLEGFTPLLSAVQTWARESPRLVRRATPPFTHRIADGISIAEANTPSGAKLESFGEHRCRLVATALLDCVEKGIPVAEWRTAVERMFEREGLSLEGAAFRTLTPIERDGAVQLAPKPAIVSSAGER